MPKTFPIMIEVEELALGPVLRRLNEMPGIAKLHLDLGHGGEGAGKKQLEQAASNGSGNNEQVAVKCLMQGPKHIGEISAALGGGKSRAYSTMHVLKTKGIVAGEGAGIWRLVRNPA